MDPETFKALSDGNRLKIIEMLADGEICACKILEALNITQPTLSHHMKTLHQCDLVNTRRVGQWANYSINENKLSEIIEFLTNIRDNLSKN